jgi:hypothetical protein
VSVLLAFAIQAWWGQTQERDTELAALTLLREDLARDSADLAGVATDLAEQSNTSTWFVRTRSLASPPADSLEAAVSRLFILDRYEEVQSGYESLRDTGRLALIHDAEVRRGVVSYYDDQQRAFVRMLSAWTDLRESVLSLLAAHTRVSTTGDITEIPRPGAAALRFNADWQELRADDELMAFLVRFGGMAASLSVMAEDLIRSNSALSSSIRDSF